MPTINGGNQQTITVPAGQTLTVVAAAGSTGQVWNLPQPGGGQPNSLQAVAAGETKTFGPYVTVKHYLVVGLTGSMTYAVASDEPANMPTTAEKAAFVSIPTTAQKAFLAAVPATDQHDSATIWASTGVLKVSGA